MVFDRFRGCELYTILGIAIDERIYLETFKATFTEILNRFRLDGQLSIALSEEH